MCDCNKTTNISMGCCQPVLGPIEAYYTKFTIDRKLEEITSAITSGCCITPEEVDEKIASAKTEIESEIPSLSGYATEEYVNAQISSQTSDFVTGVELSSFTYDKVTIDQKIAEGGSFDPTQYYTTAQTVNLVESAVTRVEAEIPTVPTNVSAFNNDAHYVTSASTETQITNHFWCGTQAEYNALPTKQNNVLYLIHE